MKKPSGTRSDEPEQSLVDISTIDQLAKIASKYDLSEVEIDLGEVRVRLARERVPVVPAVAVPAAAAPVAAASFTFPSQTAGAAEPAEADHGDAAVKSPMVGTAYLRPSPEAKPFVEVGEIVKAGDKLLLVEAMKTFNDIVAHRGGKIVSILVSDGSPVEYGQPLVVIE
ncbi:biotin carboxyl carrier protein [Roseiarcus fermentans]|uniref:Biotin carboxyl carrier protein of acetyl-CoA carboxylase n=1 Tax=Roseiarcus fermentans TaxID=1473586 RepID=A0A366FNV4_9HYPH|nr:acetyl-CoA carboxylase biotin carboxyl carrier protein [Roseiarcus fermentans]RBP15816.1 biotin carboxyl carrier protein [Roseiarcus fermentans]